MAEKRLAIFLRIEIPTSGGFVRKHYQSFQMEPYNFNGEDYERLNFDIISYPDSDLSLSSGGIQLAIGNSSVIRSLMKEYNNFQAAHTWIFHVDPDDSEKPQIGYDYDVSHHSIEGSNIVFSLKKNTNGLAGPLSTAYLSSADFRELPRYKPSI